MLSFLAEAIQYITDLGSAGLQSTTFGVTITVLLLALLIQKELLLAYDHELGSERTRMLNKAIVPLLITFIIIAATRFIQLVTA